MIPLRDVVPSRTVPYVTAALVGLSWLVFIAQLALASDEPAAARFYHTWGLVPAAFSWTSAFTSLFVHSGAVHAGSNALALWILGRSVEDRLGHARFLLLYVAGGLVAALAETWAHPASLTPVVGDGGAVAAVMAAYLALFRRSRILVLVPIFVVARDVVELPALFFLGVWLALQLLGGLARPLGAAGDAAFWTYAGGALAGLTLVWVLRRPERLRVEWWNV